jgi:hypothetical protein
MAALSAYLQVDGLKSFYPHHPPPESVRTGLASRNKSIKTGFQESILFHNPIKVDQS